MLHRDYHDSIAPSKSKKNTHKCSSLPLTLETTPDFVLCTRCFSLVVCLHSFYAELYISPLPKLPIPVYHYPSEFSNMYPIASPPLGKKLNGNAKLTKASAGLLPKPSGVKQIMFEDEASMPDAPVKRTTARQKIEDALESARGLVKASLRPLPTQTGDGSYITPPQMTGLIKDLQKMGVEDAATLIDIAKTTISGDKINDKTYSMERVIKLASELPSSSKNGAKLTNTLVGKLWSDLQHPPSSFLGDKHKYRQADGSNNVGRISNL